MSRVNAHLVARAARHYGSGLDNVVLYLEVGRRILGTIKGSDPLLELP